MGEQVSPDGPPPGWTADQVAEASQRELGRGRLPLRAQWRLAGLTGDEAFTSNLTAAEHAALRSVGFTPVGQVFGSSVYHVDRSHDWCNWALPGDTYRMGGTVVVRPRAAPVEELTQVRDALAKARGNAVRRLRQECAALGGHGVVAVRLRVERVYGSSVEFTAVGTAVRADGVDPAVDAAPGGVLPFSSGLSGQDVAKLLRAGHLPVALVLGVGAAVRHDDRGANQQRRSWVNQELDGFTALLSTARETARRRLAEDAGRHGGGTVLLTDTQVHTSERECEIRASGREGRLGHGRDHLVEVTMIGTSVVPLPGHRPAPTDAVLPMLRVGGRPARPRRDEPPAGPKDGPAGPGGSDEDGADGAGGQEVRGASSSS